MQNTTVMASGMNRKRATPNSITTGKNTMQIASVATVSGWMTSRVPSRIATVSGLPSVRLRWMFSIVTVALSTSRPIASASPPRVIRLIVLPGQEQPDQAGEDRQRDRGRDDHRVPPAAQEHQDHQRDQDRRDDRLADHVLAPRRARTPTGRSRSSVPARSAPPPGFPAARRAPRPPRPAWRRRRASGSPDRPRACR